MPIPKDNTQGLYPRTMNFLFFKDLLLKGCDSNFEVICSNVKSGYEADNYLAINNMY